ncbi:glycosyltransferase family 2 protein [candidate division TA06 bacterium]|nr:glycosyltransferase family 2 protein [candidate division TA06 bacterium]
MSEVQSHDFGISIVIPNWNGRSLLERFLPSVLKAAENYEGKWELIVVDDGSTDDSIKFLQKHYPLVRLICNPGRGGFARAANRGFRSSRFEIVILLNNDVEVKPDFILPLLDHFSDPGTFAVASKSYDLDGKTLRDGGRIGEFRRGLFRVYQNYDILNPSSSPQNSYPAFLACGGFSAFSKEKFHRMGGFDELFSPFNWEDTDLSYRAWKRGWNVHYEPRSIVYHKPNTTIQSRFQKFTIDTISKRNRLYFTWKNLSDRNLLIQHLFFLFGSLFSSLFERDFAFYPAFLMAIRNLPEVLKKRRKEKRHRQRTDREVLYLTSLWSEHGGEIVQS